MPDFARSADPAVQRQLDRLARMSPGADTLGLDRITRLLDRIGNPHLSLPPVFHVAGTNGKGSTCAFLRAAIEASGRTCHVYSSPHLVRFNERIRLAGRLVADDMLVTLLQEVLDNAEGIDASFFEVTTAAAFLAFSRTYADACVVEVGLGGRLDATNVVQPVVCGIAQLGIDHEAFLGNTIEAIAAEKAGIAKPNVPIVTMSYVPSVAATLAAITNNVDAPLFVEGTDWSIRLEAADLTYEDAGGSLLLPQPAMAGSHQAGNLGLAVAMLRHQDAIRVPEAALQAAATARWPARMQRLGAGPLVDRLPAGSEVWLDGGHNAAAATALYHVLPILGQGRPLHLVIGMLANKDADGLLAKLAPLSASVTAVPVPDHAHHAPETLASLAAKFGVPSGTAGDVSSALERIGRQAPDDAIVLILGSLYLAGDVLAANKELPS